MIILQMVGLLGQVISLSQGLYLNTGQQKHRIDTYTYQIFIPCVGFKPTIQVSERAKTVHALDRSTTVTGINLLHHHKVAGITQSLYRLATGWMTVGSEFESR
jgi:hypothetical protein